MTLRTYLLLSLFIGLTFTSCRKEEREFVQAPEDEILGPDSSISLLIQRTVSNDGSLDNIVDRANCFDILFPYSVNVNQQFLTINSFNDLETVECILDEDEDNTDTLDIVFPITIILSDFSEVNIASTSELNNYINNCNGENVYDDDIECIDFQYPIIASIFNTNNELIDTITINGDNELYEFLNDIDENDIVTIEFPITVILSDNSEIIINNLIELETAIENAEDACDEDDDYDYNDDDCDNCTITQVEDLLVSCTNWEVDKLKRNDIDYDDTYDGYVFNFFNNGTMSVNWNTTTVSGTWVASGSGNNLEVVINVPSLPLCNANWILHEVENCSAETKIDLRVGDDDRIRYENNCN
ncbi:hypothetical protein H8K90_04355 [Winogradskyella echinorum]|uniref:Lipocalin-like domain-containing protein n=1 Tax=Winogradskyella echinorum TaxID=538189 RepID=A0ABR6Y039_9FLAO|nr:hypothetical protein [Winogradskyella echinorum]MBC3845598.1 hypothetical protein [Winogradskyella echinorum]MBC5749946.1 hypothetical protein [Winogradskyella echinorum]